jgi:hypothetical protein
MEAQEWRSYFTPQEWAVFNREAARRGLSADDLAAKYLCRALDRIELAERHGLKEYGRVDRLMRPPLRGKKPPRSK